MGLFDALVLQASATGFATYPPDHDYWYQARAGVLTPSGVVVDADGARKLSAWFRGRALLMECVAMVPLEVYERLPDERGAERARAHPLYDILHRKPNAWQDSYTWRRMKVGHLIDHGNAYDLIIPGRRGFVDELWPIHPKRVTPEQLRSGRILYHVADPGGGRPVTYTQDEVFHLRGPSDDGVAGKSILQYARDSLGLGLVVETYAMHVFGRGTVSGGMIEVPTRLNPDAGKRMAESFITSVGDWGLPKILEQGAKWVKPELSPEDFQMILSRKATVDDVARWLGIPRHMLENSDPSFGNAEQFNQNFETFTIGPWFSGWEFAINDQLILAPQKYYAEFTRDAFRRSSFLERWGGHQIAVTTGIFTRNEVRRLENKNALPGLDEPLTPANITGKSTVPENQRQRSRRLDPNEDEARARGGALARESSARLLRKEVRALRRAAVKYGRDRAAWERWVTTFYAEHESLVTVTMATTPLVAHTYCQARRDEVLANLGAIEQWTPNQLVVLAAADPTGTS